MTKVTRAWKRTILMAWYRVVEETPILIVSRTVLLTLDRQELARCFLVSLAEPMNFASFLFFKVSKDIDAF